MTAWIGRWCEHRRGGWSARRADSPQVVLAWSEMALIAVADDKCVAEFRYAYAHDGLAIDEFDGYGATVRTLRGFIASDHDLVANDPRHHAAQPRPGLDSARLDAARGLPGPGFEVGENPFRVPLRPREVRARRRVVLVERHEKPDQLAANRFVSEDLRQLGEVQQPVGVPGGPIRIIAVNDAIDEMVRLAGLVEQRRDTIGLVGHCA